MSIQPYPDVAVPDPARYGRERAHDLIMEWIAAAVAEYIDDDPTAVECDAPFVELGLTSVQAVEISDRLSRWVGLELPPTLAYDYPSIDAIAGYIVDELGRPGAPAAG
ncbi:acyl carrier protein [Nocardia sp. NPDC049526]|uniref:acyl carrier protein n=1 Tax=Nocardia sp. NPDC049526 TaxID=3364316 RepID=UPI0037A577BF